MPKAECSLGRPGLGNTPVPPIEIGPAQRVKSIQPGPCAPLPSQALPPSQSSLHPGWHLETTGLGIRELSLTSPKCLAGNKSFLCTTAQPGGLPPERSLLGYLPLYLQAGRGKCISVPQISPPSPSKAAYGEPIRA